MRKIFIFLLLLPFAACSYSGSLGKNFHTPKGYQDHQKIALKIAVIQNNVIRTQQFHMVHGARDREFNIDLCPNLTLKLYQELSMIFEDIKLVDCLADAKDFQLVVEPEFISSFSNYTRTDKVDINNQLKLYFKDIRSGEVVEELTATDILRYRNPVLFYFTNFFAGLSLGFLMPIIYPIDTLSCGLHAESLLEDSMSRMLTTLSEQVVSSRRLLAWVGKSYGADTWPTIKKSKSEIMSYLDANRSRLDPIEGVWSCTRGDSFQDMKGQIVQGDTFSQNDYEIAIIPKDNDGRTFVGIVLSTTSLKWNYPGRLKGEFQATARKGEYAVKWYNDDYQLYTSIFNIDQQGNISGWFDYWSRFDGVNQRKKSLLKLIKLYPPFDKISSPKSAPLPAVAVKSSQYDYFLDSVVLIKTQQGSGSGFFIDNSGNLITNCHVVAIYIMEKGNPVQTNNYNKTVSVNLRNGQSFTCSVIAIDSERDLALVSVSGINPKPLLLGSAEQFQTGDEVIAIGAPITLEWSMSKGIISAVRQQNKDSGNKELFNIVHADPEQKQVLNPDHNISIVQTDAAINYGNSGGPLIALKTGLVVGVNTWVLKKIDKDKIAEGLNFAVAAAEIKKAFPQYIK